MHWGMCMWEEDYKAKGGTIHQDRWYRMSLMKCND